MIDPNNHVIDPVTGFAIHKDDGHIIGLEQATPPVTVGKEWPKWVVAHDSQVVRKEVDGYPTAISTPGFADSHVNRATGEVTVLVNDEDEEKRALGEYQKPEAEPLVDDDVIRRQVRRDIDNANVALAVSVNADEAEKQKAIEDEEVARRVAEQQELAARNAEAALEAAKAQRERLAEKLGTPVDPAYVRSTAVPYADPSVPRSGSPAFRPEEVTAGRPAYRSESAPSTPLRVEEQPQQPARPYSPPNPERATPVYTPETKG